MIFEANGVPEEFVADIRRLHALGIQHSAYDERFTLFLGQHEYFSLCRLWVGDSNVSKRADTGLPLEFCGHTIVRVYQEHYVALVPNSALKGTKP